MHSLRRLVLSRNSRSISTLSDQLRMKFSKFKGGSVELTKDDRSGIAKVRINNPSKRNSMSGEMMVQLHDIVADLERWDKGKALILHGTSGFFCSGADLDMVKEINTPEQGSEMAAIMQASLSGLHDLPLISVALVEGRALGGGAEMTTACDFRLMVEGAQVQFVHMRMGLVPGWGSTTRLVHLLGPNTALHVLASGCKISGDRAINMGFAEGIIRDIDHPVEKAEMWLEQYTTGNTPEIVQVVKKTIVNARSVLPAESFKEERKLFASVWGGPANKAALESKIKH
ncbi:ethylmalonyl-CoA decarboxylase-like [Ornithodoros turicata]|uniref:ethylmalonyl-CoA decarboxylase-like n=1 Tax=Ornithodoros turicata TaxID=34597 RepID=UPI0031392206